MKSRQMDEGHPLNSQLESSPKVNSPLHSAWCYVRIEPEAGGAARRICRNVILGNRRRDGREGRIVLSLREDGEAVIRLHREPTERRKGQIKKRSRVCAGVLY